MIIHKLVNVFYKIICNDLGFQPDPTTVIMDFAINAVTNTICPHVHIQDCFYHLTQSTWRKIQ